jgi:hypothetical protein
VVLKNEFVERARPVVDDRHCNRAHPFEREHASAEMIALGALSDARVLQGCKELLNELSLDPRFNDPHALQQLAKLPARVAERTAVLATAAPDNMMARVARALRQLTS